MANTSRYRYIQFYGGRILQAREVAELQRIQEGLNTNGTSRVALDANACYKDGATFNILPSVNGQVVTLNKIDNSDYMYVFVRGRWEILQTSEIANSLTIPNAGGNIYLNWTLRQVTSSEDATLVDSNTGEPTADMGELDLSVSTSDSSGVALTNTQFEKNTAPIVLFSFSSSMSRVRVDNVYSRAIGSTQTSGLVGLSTDTSGVALATDDPRLQGIGSVADGSIVDSKIRTPSASGGTNQDGTNIYSLSPDPGGINSAKIVHLPGTQLVSDVIEWIKNKLNSITATFNSHIGARLGAGVHPMPTASDVNAAPLSHVSLGLGVQGSHPPNVSADSGGWRLDRSAAAAAQNDPGFGLFQSGTLISGLLHEGDVYSANANNAVANPTTGTTGALGKLGVLATVLAEHVNQTSHKNPHGLALSDLGVVTAPGTNGWLNMAGIYIQWGTTGVLNPNDTQTFNFPTQFPNQCFGVNVSCMSSPRNEGRTVYTRSWNQSSFQAGANGNDCQLFWIAIGN